MHQNHILAIDVQRPMHSSALPMREGCSMQIGHSGLGPTNAERL